MSLILFSFSNCGGTKTNSPFETDPPFQVDTAYAQDWVAGVQGGGSGTNFYITISDMQEGVVCKEVYFGKRGTALVSTPNVPGRYVGYFKNPSNQEVIMDGETSNEAVNIPPLVSPFKLGEKEAVIRFIVNGVQKDYKITEVEIKEPLAYPGVNPNGID